MTEHQDEIDRIEQGGGWDDSDEVIVSDVKRPLDKVIPIRLSSEHWEALRREAQAVGVGPSTLARIWLIERLRHGSMQSRAG